MNFERETIIALVRDALVEAGSTFRADKKAAYARAIANETDEKASGCWKRSWKTRKLRKRTARRSAMIRAYRTCFWKSGRRPR